MQGENQETQEQPQTENTEAPEQEQQEEVPEQPETPPEEVEAKDGEEGAEEDGGEDEDEPEEGQAPAKKKKRTGFQRRFERLERELLEERQRRAYAEQLAAQYAQPQQQPQQQAAAGAKPPPEQQLQEYLGVLVQQGVHQVLSQRDQEQAARQLEQKWEAQIAAAPDEDEQYESRRWLAEARQKLAPGPVRDALLTSEYAPRILSALRSNPRELARISALPEGQAAREIGRLEAQFAAAGATPAKPKPASRPPPPPTTVGGSKKSTGDVADLPLSEYKRRLRSGGR